MSPLPSNLLCLMLCLGQMIHMQEGVLPKPSLRVEPGPVIPRGRPVTFVCQGPVGAKSFRLENKQNGYKDEPSAPQRGSKGTEARFHFNNISEKDAGNYFCCYLKVPSSHNQNQWSVPSETLQLQVTKEDISTTTSGAREEISSPTSSLGPASQDYKVDNSIRMGLAGVVLLILVAILVEAGLSQLKAPQGPQE